MIDLNAALADLEQDGYVRLYHAKLGRYWTCSVFFTDYGGEGRGEAVHYAVAETAEGAIALCVAKKANKAARERLGALLTPLAPRGWGR